MYGGGVDSDCAAVGAFKVGALAGALEAGGWRCLEVTAVSGSCRAACPVLFLDVATGMSHTVTRVMTHELQGKHTLHASCSYHSSMHIPHCIISNTSLTYM